MGKNHFSNRFCVVIAFAAAACLALPAVAHEPNQHHAPFQTIQPGVGPITLTYRGDALFEYYEDADGYIVVLRRGRYYYATVNSNGAFDATNHLVGEVEPSRVGLRPGTLPSASKIASLRSRAADAVRPFAEPDPADLPPNTTLIDGCIVVPNEQLPSFDAGSGGSPQNGTHITSDFWEDGIVPYTFDGTVNATNQQLMRDAMDAWEAVANVQFVPRTTEPHYIEVISSSGNWSYVGRVGGKQQLSIYNWTYQFIIMHELAHALGVWHEQSRPDRDTYVQIESANITSGMEHNFDKHNSAGTTGTYDFDSIMHYGQCAFSNCACSSSCRTITVLAPNTSWQGLIGQRSHLSTGDVATMEALYGAPATDDAAQMTAPAVDGDLIPTSSFAFAWSTGTGVTQYEFLVGTTLGGSDLHSYTGTAKTRTVSGLPTNGSTIYVTLKSQISSTWYTNRYTYAYGVDTCPGFSDLDDADNDGVPDGCDECPGQDDNLDSDNDGTPNCLDECPSDANKTAAGDCGCGNVETDTDGDGTSDCADECPNNPARTEEGVCGCDGSDVDSDGDATPDCNDECPNDPSKINPGICGCGASVRDFDGDGDFECDDGSGVPIDLDSDNRGVGPTINVSACGATGPGLLVLGMTMLFGSSRRRVRRQS